MQSHQSNSMQSIKYNLIVAMCKNKGIGYKGRLPWNFIKEDMQYFSKMTKGTNVMGTNVMGTNVMGTNANEMESNCIIMGRNTWDSLPRKKPLPKRDNLVLSSTLNLNEYMPDEHIAKSFRTIDDLDTYCKEQKYDTCWVIGGAKIYKQFMKRKLIDKCYITYIDAKYKCDVFFDFPEKEWQIISETISETSISETSISETSISETSISETSISETSISETSLSETSISETSLSETSLSETSKERLKLKFQIFISTNNYNRDYQQ
jgi:dihydrofolate reductase